MSTENKKPENPVAFPRTAFNSNGDITTFDSEFEGMSLRDYFANSAMSAIISNADSMREITKAFNKSNNLSFEECIAKLSYSYADGMLSQRIK